VIGRRRIFLAVALAAFTGSSSVARAQMNDRAATAQALFDEGLALMNANRLAEACPKLAKSQELDPGMGTAFRLGECYEKTGRLASAWELFVGVAASARKENAAQRAALAQKRADALSPRLAKLVVEIAPAAAATEGLMISRDGVELSRQLLGAPIPIDAGEHEIRVSAPGKKPFVTKISVPNEPRSISVTIPALADAPIAAPPAIVVAPQSPSGRGQRIAGVVVGAVGIAGLGVGAAFGAIASSSWNAALAGCVDHALDKCSASAQDKGSSAKTQALISTIGFASGGVLTVGGVVLFLAAPSAKREARTTSPRIDAWAGPGAAGLSLKGAL